MTKPLADALPPSIAGPLAERFNVRSLDQFFALMNDPARAEALSKALGCAKAELEAHAAAARAANPGVGPTAPAEDVALGYGKKKP